MSSRLAQKWSPHTGPHFILHPVQVDSFPCHVEDQRPGEKAMVIIFALFGFSLWLNYWALTELSLCARHPCSYWTGSRAPGTRLSLLGAEPQGSGGVSCPAELQAWWRLTTETGLTTTGCGPPQQLPSSDGDPLPDVTPEPLAWPSRLSWPTPAASSAPEAPTLTQLSQGPFRGSDTWQLFVTPCECTPCPITAPQPTVRPADSSSYIQVDPGVRRI